MAAIFDLLVIATSERVHINHAVLLDPENVDVVCGISLLSSIAAEIVRYFVCTSGNGAYL